MRLLKESEENDSEKENMGNNYCDKNEENESGENRKRSQNLRIKILKKKLKALVKQVHYYKADGLNKEEENLRLKQILSNCDSEFRLVPNAQLLNIVQSLQMYKQQLLQLKSEIYVNQQSVDDVWPHLISLLSQQSQSNKSASFF